MYTILKQLDRKRVTPTREMTVTLAECCHCGTVQEVLLQNVQRANRQKRKHCALCIEEEFHRMTDTRIWRIWKGMKDRATSPSSPDYPRYGGSGRGVCARWLEFKNFYEDMSSGYQDGLTLERIDNGRGYSPENCRWATNMDQQANKTNNRVLEYQGEEIHLAEFCRRTGVTRGAISPRLNAGMNAEQALTDYQNSTYPKGRKSRLYTTS